MLLLLVLSPYTHCVKGSRTLTRNKTTPAVQIRNEELYAEQDHIYHSYKRNATFDTMTDSSSSPASVVGVPKKAKDDPVSYTHLTLPTSSEV